MEKFLKVLASRRMLVSLFLGFSSGLPLLLTLSTLQAWMTEAKVDLKTIGLFALVGSPYTYKFLWAPLMDRYAPPFLGRRRGWLLVTQVLVALAIAALGLQNPAENPMAVALCAVLVAFFSASQDIVADAYRREALADEELGLGSSLFVNGYRIAMLLGSGGSLVLADALGSWKLVYLVMAACMGVGILTTLFAPEPQVDARVPKSLKEAVIEPLKDYFTRDKAFLILAFILLYKLGDTMASAMTMPFYIQLGFTKTEIGAVVKVFGLWATLAGAFVGGSLILRLGIHRSLWVFGILQALSTAGFSALAMLGPKIPALMAVISFENLTAGMGTSAYVAFMGSLTNKKFTATQYALLSSLMGIPRVFASAPTGYLAEQTGWAGFFLVCTVAALPGLLMIGKMKESAQENASPIVAPTA